jgi:ATP-dependent Clp protease ATP-binding subunit ClpA
MFERFTRRARAVVVKSQEEARGLQHNYIGTEHLLLGLLDEPGGVAAQALDKFGMTLEIGREEVIARVGRGKRPVSAGHIPFTPRAKKVLELALREALSLQHNYIGTEHILLGVIREGDGVGAQILKARAGDLPTVRAAVLEVLPPAERSLEHSRRWLRRRAPTEDLELTADPDDELRTTPAAGTSLEAAARLAGSQPVGSHHLLLAALADPNTAAARTLAGLGLDLDQARAALLSADLSGSSDELPAEAGRRQLTVTVTDEAVTLTATDPVLIRRARDTAGAVARATGGEPGPIRGDHALSASLSVVWEALHDSLDDIRRRAAAAAGTESADTGSAGTGSAGTEATGTESAG